MIALTAPLDEDSKGRIWHAIERDDKTVSVYYTRKGCSTHFVVYDTDEKRTVEKP